MLLSEMIYSNLMLSCHHLTSMEMHVWLVHGWFPCTQEDNQKGINNMLP